MMRMGVYKKLVDTLVANGIDYKVTTHGSHRDPYEHSEYSSLSKVWAYVTVPDYGVVLRCDDEAREFIEMCS